LTQSKKASSTLADYTSGKAQPKPKSWIFRRCPKVGGKNVCNIYKKSFLGGFTSPTAYLLEHFHKVFSTSVSNSSGQSKLDEFVKCGKARESKISRTIAIFFTVDLYPPHLVSGMGFKNLMALLASGFQIPNRTTFARSFIPTACKQRYASLLKINLNLRICFLGNNNADLPFNNLCYAASLTMRRSFPVSKLLTKIMG
jgi:hypothetical protein